MKRLTTLTLMLLASALACGQEQLAPGRAHIGPASEKHARGWQATMYLADGQPIVFGEWNTREECEADLPRLEKSQNATSGECHKTPPLPPGKTKPE